MEGIELLSTKQQRARRRNATFRIAVQRRDAHIQAAHSRYWHDPSPENIDCVCELSHHYFAKQRAQCNSFRKRIFGNPKYVTVFGFMRMAVDARIRSRRLVRDLASGRLDPDDVLPARAGFWMFV